MSDHGFRCYYRSANSGRLVPVRGAHYYDNGMYKTRDLAKAAADSECALLNQQHPNRHYAVRQL